MSRDVLRRGLKALVFLGLCACLLLSGEMLRRDGGRVVMDRVDLPGGTAVLYRPAGVTPGATAPDAGHGASMTNRCPAALVLSDALDGSGSLAVELSRRGVAVLLAGEKIEPAGAWDWLAGQSFAAHSAVGLAAAGTRSGEALDLAVSLTGSGRECAALMLIADRDVLARAGDSAVRNMLLFVPAPEAGAAEAFLGSSAAAERGFAGYFGEGTARALVSLRGSGRSFARRDIMERIIDWQGSALGHAVELSDDDMIHDQIRLCRMGAALCAAGALGALVPVSGPEHKKEKQPGRGA